MTPVFGGLVGDPIHRKGQVLLAAGDLLLTPGSAAGLVKVDAVEHTGPGQQPGAAVQPAVRCCAPAARPWAPGVGLGVGKAGAGISISGWGMAGSPRRRGHTPGQAGEAASAHGQHYAVQPVSSHTPLWQKQQRIGKAAAGRAAFRLPGRLWQHQQRFSSSASASSRTERPSAGQAAFDQGRGDRIFQVLADGAAQFPRAELGGSDPHKRGERFGGIGKLQTARTQGRGGILQA